MSDLAIGDVVTLPPLAADTHRPSTAPIVAISGEYAIMAYDYQDNGISCSATLTYPLSKLQKVQ